MARTKLFISYSHRDDGWLERLKMHLAPLERRKIVHVWSDTRIRLGDRWETEIESALTESRAAVLMISPAFLASEYIWEKEMPHILRHRLAGMLVFPLITKPCAWRIAPELAELQARPLNGRALSLGTDPAADNDLAEFVYELGSLLGQLTSSVATEEADRMRRQSEPKGEYPVSPQGRVEKPVSGEMWLKPGRAWTGTYRPTNRPMQLVFRTVQDPRDIRGTIEYPNEGVVTEFEGAVLDQSEIDGDARIAAIGSAASGMDGAIVFREVREVGRVGSSINPDGEYRAIVAGSRMSGFWESGSIPAKYFEFTCEE
jgi:hypothetical protein